MKKAIILIFIIVCFAGQVISQNKDGKVILPDSIQFDEIIITEVKITGNKLTKDDIITRELDFKMGDTLSTILRKRNKYAKLKRSAPSDSSELLLRMDYSRENIINTKLQTLVLSRLTTANTGF